MDLNIKQVNYLLSIIILCSILPQSLSVLSFIYPQSTTLKNKNILVVEEKGIYICNPSFSNVIEIVHTFSEEDKITSQSKLSKTLIKKSSFVILILTNYKLYIIDVNTGELLYKGDSKIITDATPEYMDLAYTYSKTNNKFYFTISYIDSDNYLIIDYYEFFIDDKSIYLHDSASLNCVTRVYGETSYTFYFQNKGLACENVVDNYNGGLSYITCFIIGRTEGYDYLIPITFDDQSNSISLFDDYYDMGLI
jgi:hypothetical protein